MAHAIGRAVRQQASQRSALNWSGEDGLACGVCSSVTRRFISSQPYAVDVNNVGAVIAPAPSVDGPFFPRAWSHVYSQNASQAVVPKGKRLFLVDTLALVRRLESQGMTPKQSEAITAVMTEVLNDSLENVGQTFTSVYEMQRSEMVAEAALSKFKGQMQSSQDHHFAMLQQELERLRTDIDKMRNESNYAIDKVTSGQRLDLNLERG